MFFFFRNLHQIQKFNFVKLQSLKSVMPNIFWFVLSCFMQNISQLKLLSKYQNRRWSWHTCNFYNFFIKFVCNYHLTEQTSDLQSIPALKLIELISDWQVSNWVTCIGRRRSLTVSFKWIEYQDKYWVTNKS